MSDEAEIIADNLSHQETLARKLFDTAKNREEILTAFVAKYGCQPERLCVVHQSTPVGWNEFAVHLSDEDIAKGKEQMALLMAQGWQPIATAPKDGTRVLGTSEEEDYVYTMWYDLDVQLWVSPAVIDEYRSPTHWMPLPHPPKGTT
jgi:hypothetical protein